MISASTQVHFQLILYDLDHGVGHFAYLPTGKRMSNKGHNLTGIFPIPQTDPRRVSSRPTVTRSHAALTGRDIEEAQALKAQRRRVEPPEVDGRYH